MPLHRKGTASWKRRRRRLAPTPSSFLATSLLLLLLLLLLGSTHVAAFCARSSSNNNNPSPSPPPTPPLIDRVPTFRLYQRGVCQTQVPGRGDVADCRARLHEAITGLAKSTPTTSILNDSEKGSEKEGGSSSTTSGRGRAVAAILEIDSLTALESMLAEQQQQQQKHLSQDDNEVLLVEFYGQACKQCIALAPLFESLPFVYRDRRLRFGRADVTNFPALVVPPPPSQAFHDLDRSQDIEQRLEGCPRCGGVGFVACMECEGKGHLIRSVDGHRVADVCMSCVGQKKVPCPQCGGKCYLC
jgi:thiol-disulfide isomerase/thioredoxin